MLIGLLAPRAVRGYWSWRSSNPVRRGMQLASDLGCFHCHGQLGGEGLPDPLSLEVPAWSGGVWMMYVDSDDEIREYILDGISQARARARGRGGGADEHGIKMPAYRDVIDARDLEDLVATFKVLAGMNLPPADSAARRGRQLAANWRCFACHGPAGAGGLPNPGSFAGFIPGWYGPDFDDLVRDRGEFDGWIRDGTIPRLADSALGSFFLKRQRVPMPAYPALTDAELDDLWAYVQWLAETGGGYQGGVRPF